MMHRSRTDLPICWGYQICMVYTLCVQYVALSSCPSWHYHQSVAHVCTCKSGYGLSVSKAFTSSFANS